jgi:hypothetical protein
MAININAVRDVSSGDVLLSSTTGIDLATAPAEPTLYTVPGGQTVVVTKFIVRVTAASSVVGAAVAGVGTDAAEGNMLPPRTLTGLTAVDDDYLVFTETKQVIGNAGAIIKFGIDTAITSGTLTVTVDLFGYFVDVPITSFAPLPSQVTGPERTAGTETGLRSFSPEDVAVMSGAHGAPTQVSGPERTAGTEVALRSFSPEDVAVMAALHSGHELIASYAGVSTGNLSLACPAGALGVDGDHLLLVMHVEIGGSAVGFYIDLNGTNISAGNNFSANLGVINTAHVFRTGASAQACFSRQTVSTSDLTHGRVTSAHSNAGVLTFNTNIWSGLASDLTIRSAKVYKVRI